RRGAGDLRAGRGARHPAGDGVHPRVSWPVPQGLPDPRRHGPPRLAGEAAAERLVERGELALLALGLDLGAGVRLLARGEDVLAEFAIDVGDERRERVGSALALVQVDGQVERRRLAVVQELEHALVEARRGGLRVEHAPPVVVARMRLDGEDQPVATGHCEVVVVDEPVAVRAHSALLRPGRAGLYRPWADRTARGFRRPKTARMWVYGGRARQGLRP